MAFDPVDVPGGRGTIPGKEVGPTAFAHAATIAGHPRSRRDAYFLTALTNINASLYIDVHYGHP